MFRELSRAESNAKAALASLKPGSKLACFAPSILFSFSLKRYWGYTGTWVTATSSAPPYLHPTPLLWVLVSNPQGEFLKKGGELRGRDRC